MAVANTQQDDRLFRTRWGLRQRMQPCNDRLALPARQAGLCCPCVPLQHQLQHPPPCCPPSRIRSNYGSKTVQLAAPGTDILSTNRPGYRSRQANCTLTDLYCTVTGTSEAAPFVAGAAALAKAASNRRLTNVQVKAGRGGQANCTARLRLLRCSYPTQE